jgi:hypothetical protein
VERGLVDGRGRERYWVTSREGPTGQATIKMALRSSDVLPQTRVETRTNRRCDRFL